MYATPCLFQKINSLILRLTFFLPRTWHPSIVETLPNDFPDLKHEFGKLESQMFDRLANFFSAFFESDVNLLFRAVSIKDPFDGKKFLAVSYILSAQGIKVSFCEGQVIDAV